MNVYKTEFNGIKIICLNMPFTNDTLVSSPSVDGRKIDIIIYGKQIAEEIKNDEKTRKKIYHKIVKERNIMRRIIGA